MGMDGLPVDEHGGWLYPLISWHDPRTGPQHQWWQEHIGAEKVFSIGGNPLWPINSALRILWMAENEPEILRRADKWLLIEDFLNFMLCGRQVTDYSMASCTLLFDQRSLGWSDELIELSGIDRRLLCEVQPSGTLLGEVHDAAAAATGLLPGTPVVLGGHDHLCGALPVGAFRPGVVLERDGHLGDRDDRHGRPVLKDELRRAGMTVQAHVARGMHTVWGGNVAGEMLEWYRRELAVRPPPPIASTGDTDWEQLMAEAAGVARRRPRRHVPAAHVGCGLPGGRSAEPGSVRRAQHASDPRRHAAGDRSKGWTTSSLDIVSAMESALGSALDQFVAVGGATRNDFWMQNKADVVGRPVEVPDVEKRRRLGAAILAGIGVGLYQDEEDALRARLPTRARPTSPIRNAPRSTPSGFDLSRSVSGREPRQPSSVRGIRST